MNKLWQRGDCVYSFSLNGSGTSIEFILQSSYKFSCNTTLVLPGVHGMGASKVLKLFVDLVEVGVGPTLVLSSVHGMDAIKYYYCIVSFTNPLAAGSGLVKRTPKKVLPPPIWSFSSPSFVVQRNTKLPKN